MSYVLFRVCYARRVRDPEKRVRSLLANLRDRIPEIEPHWVQSAPFFQDPEVGVLVRLPRDASEEVIDRIRDTLERRRIHFEEQRLVAEETREPFGAFIERESIEKMVEAGKAFCHIGLLTEGLDELQTALELEPGCTEAYHYLVAILRQLGRPQEAESWLLRGLSLHHDSSSYHYLLASVFQEIGKLDEALSHLKRAIRLDPDSGILYCCLGNVLQKMGREQAARLAYEEALAKELELAEAALGLGGLLLEQGRLGEAMDWLVRAISIDSNCVEARLKLGWCYLHLGETETAEIEFLQVANGPAVEYHFPARFSLGRLYVLSGNDAIAEEILDEICSQQPELGEAHRFLAEACSNLGDHEKALTHWEKACELMPDAFEQLRPHMALALSRAGRLVEAEAVLLEVLERTGARADILEVLASVHMAREDWKLAREVLEQGEAVDPESAMIAFQQGWVSENLGETRQAFAYYNKAVRLDPELYEAYCGLGWLYYELGDYDIALVLFEQAHQLAPDNAEYLDHIGWVNLLLENHSEALGWFEKAVKLEPDCAFFRSHRGAALFHLGLHEHARLELEDVLAGEVDPMVEAFARYVLGLVLSEEGKAEQAEEEFIKSTQTDELPPEFVAMTSKGRLAGGNPWQNYRHGAQKGDSALLRKLSGVVNE